MALGIEDNPYRMLLGNTAAQRSLVAQQALASAMAQTPGIVQGGLNQVAAAMRDAAKLRAQIAENARERQFQGQQQAMAQALRLLEGQQQRAFEAQQEEARGERSWKELQASLGAQERIAREGREATREESRAGREQQAELARLQRDLDEKLALLREEGANRRSADEAYERAAAEARSASRDYLQLGMQQAFNQATLELRRKELEQQSQSADMTPAGRAALARIQPILTRLDAADAALLTNPKDKKATQERARAVEMLQQQIEKQRGQLPAADQEVLDATLRTFGSPPQPEAQTPAPPDLGTALRLAVTPTTLPNLGSAFRIAANPASLLGAPTAAAAPPAQTAFVPPPSTLAGFLESLYGGGPATQPSVDAVLRELLRVRRGF